MERLRGNLEGLIQELEEQNIICVLNLSKEAWIGVERSNIDGKVSYIGG